MGHLGEEVVAVTLCRDVCEDLLYGIQKLNANLPLEVRTPTI